MQRVKIAILGIGNVGTGVWKILTMNKEQVSARSGYDIEVAKVLVRDKKKKRNVEVPEEVLTDSFDDIINDDSIKIVVELMGGVDPAKNYMLKAIKSGKHVVTANKFALATCGKELAEAAEEFGVKLNYEASVAGGIPIIHGITESLTANKILNIVGIINGTTNYILTKMTLNGMEFEDALKEAQQKGYAEADPTSDVEGYDAMYKIGILSSLSFGGYIDVDSIYREGITSINSIDIEYAKEFGYVIKLLAIAKQNDGLVELRVHPAMIPATHPLANVNDSFNAIFIKGNAVGDLMLYGRGAGDLPTGSAVVGDIIAILKNGLDKNVERNTFASCPLRIKDMEDTRCEYYIRVTASDTPGTLGAISNVFGGNGVSLASVIQKGKGDVNVPLVFVTHETLEKNINKSIKEIKAMESVVSVDNLIRVENI
ncbi:homoserine dehydrogenase [Clostridium oryzae]|uniref:Homoserine dehydrogenase n=1 Tax=Clostridium oryzae TaxID=1450648 RepID=A0A1V4IPD5_9CLOT|nr:homoserine dehydrogenase [Clostridium oryzae]OPJ61665.1 homoserine dehydrogenase [Clostridium oryzae]